MRPKTNVFIYGYSPQTIELKPLKNLIIIVPESKKEKYIRIGFHEKKVKTVQYMTVKLCFVELKHIEKEYEIEKVFTLDEAIMDWCGLLNDFFTKVRSQSLQSALFKDKYLMRVFLQGVVSQPAFYTYSELGGKTYNMLAKPRKMASANGIMKCNSQADIEAITSKDEYVFEENVQYDEMFTVDGYAINGKIKRFFSHQYDGKILESVQQNSNEGHVLVYTNSYYWKDSTLIERLYQISEKILAVFCRDTITPFHFEFFYKKKKQQIVFCEVGSRFGGGRIPQLIKDAFNCDVLNEYWQTQVSAESLVESFDEQIMKPSRVAATFMALTVNGLITKDIRSHFNGVQEYLQYKMVGTLCSKAQSVDELLYMCRFVAKDEKEMNHKVKELVKLSKMMFDF